MLLLLTIAAPLLGRPAVAQTPGAPTDSVAPDSVLTDSARADSVKAVNPHDPRLAAAIIGIGVGMFVAPSALLLFVPAADTTRPTLIEDYVSVYVTAGFSEYSESEGSKQWGLTHSQNLEFLRNGVYGALRIENLRVPDHVQLQDARIGYLIYADTAWAGGVTLGYRRAHGGGFAEGFEIGFPLLFQGPNGRMIVESAYVVSSHAADLSWRFRGEFSLPRTPLVAGLSLEAKAPLRDNGISASSLGLSFGIRR